MVDFRILQLQNGQGCFSSSSLQDALLGGSPPVGISRTYPISVNVPALCFYATSKKKSWESQENGYYVEKVITVETPNKENLHF